MRITGANLSEATAVQFGLVSASDVEVLSPTSIRAASPPGIGTVDVTVMTPYGASTTSSADQFTYEVAPAVLTGAASSLGQASATLNATVDPEGAPVSDCHFEYGTSPAYGSNAPCSSLPGSGTSSARVSASVTGLSANTTHYFRIVASNAGGTSYASEQTFKTLSNQPTVVTSPGSSVPQTSVTLSPSVSPNDGAAGSSSCELPHRTTTGGGSSASCVVPSPGSGAAPHQPKRDAKQHSTRRQRPTKPAPKTKSAPSAPRLLARRRPAAQR